MNSLPEVLPILNSNEPKSVHTDVSISDFHFTNCLPFYYAKSNISEGNRLVTDLP